MSKTRRNKGASKLTGEPVQYIPGPKSSLLQRMNEQMDASLEPYLTNPDNQAERTGAKLLAYGLPFSMLVAAGIMVTKSLFMPDSVATFEQSNIPPAQSVETRTSSVDASRGADFMNLVLQHARNASGADGPDSSHTCPELPIIDPATAPNMTTPEGWLEAMNELRSVYGAPPLRLNAQLMSSAKKVAESRAAAGIFEHTKLSDSVGTYVPNWQKIGENIGRIHTNNNPGQEQIDAFVCYADSNGHLSAMVDPHYTDMGVDPIEPFAAETPLGQKQLGISVVHFVQLPR